MVRFAWLLLLAACPAPPHYLIADVLVGNRPVEGALVAVDCGPSVNAALRTDDSGRARVPVRYSNTGGCAVVVAMPGYETQRVVAASLCTTTSACPRMQFELEPR